MKNSITIIREAEITVNTVALTFNLKIGDRTIGLLQNAGYKKRELSGKAATYMVKMVKPFDNLAPEELIELFGIIEGEELLKKKKESVRDMTKNIVEWFSVGIVKAKNVAKERNLNKWLIPKMEFEIKF